jgi:hypothetical protein
MPRKAPNLRSGIPLIGGTLVDDLNTLGDSLGLQNVGGRLATALNRRFSTVNGRADALSGLQGSVVIAPQKRRAERGQPESAIKLSGGRIGEVDRAITDDQVPNWGQVRGLFTCEAFGGHVSGFEGWVEECVDSRETARTQPSLGDGIVHAFWGYTYQIPDFLETRTNDPGRQEFGEAYYWETIVPENTQVDRVSFQIPPDLGPPVTRPGAGIQIGIYDMNVSGISFPVLARTAVVPVTAFATGVHTFALDTRILIPAGRYAVAMVAPCMNFVGIVGNTLLEKMENIVYSNAGLLNRFGIIQGPEFTMTLPAVLDESNVILDPDSYFTAIPVLFFDDSQEYA